MPLPYTYGFTLLQVISMFTVYFLLFLLPPNWVLAAESPPSDLVMPVFPIPPAGEGRTDGLVIRILLELTQDMKEVKKDVSQVKADVSQVKEDVSQVKGDVSQVQLDQAVLQQDLTRLEENVTSINLVSAATQIKLEGKYKILTTIFYVLCMLSSKSK